MVMKIYDVTHPISASMLSFPGVSPPSFVQEDRGLYLVSDLHLSSHCGTHIDAPFHYLKHGATIDQMPLEPVVGPCQVIDLSANGSEIRRPDLQEEIGDQERVLLKTAFSKAAGFYAEFPHLSRDAAELLVERHTSCVGIDSPSIEAFKCDGSVHRLLLGNNCIVLEMLDLSRVREGNYWMAALPLPLVGVDGSPARTILIDRFESQ